MAFKEPEFEVFDNASNVRSILREHIKNGRMTQEQAATCYRKWREKCEAFKNENKVSAKLKKQGFL